MLNALRKSQQVPSRGGATADESHVKVRKNLLKLDIFIELYCGIKKITFLPVSVEFMFLNSGVY